MHKVDEFIMRNPTMSGNAIARELGQDSGYIRKRIRTLRAEFPDMEWTPRRPKKLHSTPIGSVREVDVSRTFIINDIHIPFHDPHAVAVALAMIDDLKPERIFLNGDIVDFYAISRFNKCPKRELEMQDEIDATSAFLHTLRAVAPDADIDFIEGNHEGRLAAYVNDSNRRAMSSLRCLTVPELLGLDSLGINYIESRGRTAFATDGLVKVGHFNRVSKFSAYTGKLLLDQFMCSLVQGHTHRLGTHFRTVAGSGTYVAAEGGCLCDLDPEYANAPDWQHGVTIISRLNGSERFHIQQVPIIDHEAFFDGKRYSG